MGDDEGTDDAHERVHRNLFLAANARLQSGRSFSSITDTSVGASVSPATFASSIAINRARLSADEPSKTASVRLSASTILSYDRLRRHQILVAGCGGELLSVEMAVRAVVL